jgi:small-conductance mechanosensitive channel
MALSPFQMQQPDWQPLLDRLGTELPRLVEQMLTPWMLPQLVIVPIAYLAAGYLAPWMRRHIDPWLARQPISTRMLVLIGIPLRQLKWIIFILLLSLTLAVARQVTWASRSYVIDLASSLATAWLAINLASALIRNPALQRTFEVATWSIAALSILGVLDDVQGFLDSLAIEMGEIRLSVLLLLKGAIILGVSLWLANILSTFLERRLHGPLQGTPTLEVLVGKILKALLIAAAVVFALSAIGIKLTALAVFSGAVGLGIGFGLQKVASNLMSGIIILIDKSVKPGDVIQRGNTFGWITALRARYVSVATREGVEYLIPNEDFITSQVINWSYSNPRVRIEVKLAVAAESDPHRVGAIACDAARRVPRVLGEVAPEAHVVAFSPASLDLVLRFWIADPEEGVTNIRSDVMLAVWDALKAHGITMLSAKG